ncbi:MAG: hypothetical protein ACJ8E2_18655 [Bradyrhizobium sp.]
MTKSAKSAYRDSLLGLFVVFGVVFVIGVVSDGIERSRTHFEKAEGFIADLHAIATGVPRLPDGSITRQGPVSTAWLDDVSALPARLGAMAGTLRGGEDQRSLGLVRRGPWSTGFDVETKDSLVWIRLFATPKAVCEQLERAIAKHPDRAAYVNSSGDPPAVLAALGPNWMCRQDVNNLVLVTLDPQTEIRRLTADVQNAIKIVPANVTGKLPISGSSAPFHVTKDREGGPGFIQRDQSVIRVTINNVPFAICRLALLIGPEAFGMEAFEALDGKAVQPPPTQATSLCNALRGRLILSRRVN